MPNTKEIKIYQNSINKTKTNLIIALIINIVLNLFAPGGLIYLVQLLNALQIILHLPLFAIWIPANAQFTFSTIVPIAGFDVLDAWEDNFLQQLMHTKDEEYDVLNINDQVQMLSYDSHNAILNLGSMSVMMMIYLLKVSVLVVFLLPFQKLAYKC